MRADYLLIIVSIIVSLMNSRRIFLRCGEIPKSALERLRD